MGTNYYWTPPAGEPCPHCGQAPEAPKARHIGKSSAGWCFALHVYPKEGINTLEDWKALWSSGGAIQDGYGKDVAVDRMLEIITERRGVEEPSAEWLRQNHAVAGPCKLARHALHPHHVIGHGEGTWDYIIGDFS